MNSQVVHYSKRHRLFIIAFIELYVSLHGFQNAVRQLDAVFPSHYRRSFQFSALNALRSRVCSRSRLLLISGGQLCTLLAKRLLCFNGQCAVRDAFSLGRSALSRRHFFDYSTVTCSKTLEGHWHYSVVRSVAFDSRDYSLLATGSSDNTARLWRFSPDGSNAICVSTLIGHSCCINSVAFHPTASILVTGSSDSTAKLWRFSPNGWRLTAICVATLTEHSDWVLSVAFHQTLSLLATCSRDNTAKLWRLSSDNSSATCVATLEGHSDDVRSVAFHPTAPLLATGSVDKTAKLWRLSSDNSSATCVATLEGHGYSVISVAFHPTAPLLAISSHKTAKLFRFSPDGSTATCVATLEGHSNTVFSVAFHPTAPILVTGSSDGNAKLWR